MSIATPSSTRPQAIASEERLSALVLQVFGAAPAIAKMPGGASTRRYFRCTVPDGRTAVAIFVPEGGRPEEAHRGGGPRSGRWPFLEIRDLLAEHGIDVPAILADDTENGWLVIEDLGDDTLANWLKKHPQEREPLYQRAVRDLARAQNELASVPAGSLIADRTFDYEVLRWEIEHFREWCLDGRGRPLAKSDRARWDDLADRLARRVAALPCGFVHRDYQSRNIMVVPRGDGSVRLVWIDFQDALLGPRVYDLVSLLNDSYQSFDRAFVEARLADYADAAALSRGPSIEGRSGLHREFDLVTAQRKLKDAGRFVFIAERKGNDAFVKFVTPAIKKIGGALARLAPEDDEMGELRSILERTLGDEIDA